MFKVNDVVLFTAPPNVTFEDHGLMPGDVVSASIVETNYDGNSDWYLIEYDRVFSNTEGGLWTAEPTSDDSTWLYQREVSAHISELTEV